MFEHVLKPGRIGSCELKNRFVMPAMGSGHTQKGGLINEETIAYYRERARGGFGLLITEFVSVDPEGTASHPQMRIYDDSCIERYYGLVEAVHAEGAKIFMQLHHAGRGAGREATGKQLVTASRIPTPFDTEVIRPLATEEVYRLIERFGDGAVRAKKAGFDGVEIHGANGYMVAQFMSEYTNKRTDEFGGDIIGRAKLPVEIIKNIKKKCGRDFPVTIRISGDETVEGGMRLNESRVFCRLFEEAGADAINVTVGLPMAFGDRGSTLASYRFPMGFNSYAAEEVKHTVKIPVIGGCRIVDPAMADTVIADGMVDFVTLGRASIADPHFPNKVREGRLNEISPCVGCMATCIVGPDTPGTTCAFNPFSGHESELIAKPAEKSKRVVVVGGGVGGMEAAWVCAMRGHRVTLLEASDHLGGQCCIAAVPRYKQRLALVVRYYTAMCEKYGVDVRLNTEATAETVLSFEPEAVVLATGAKPVMLNVPNEGGIEVLQANDVIAGTVMPGRSCLVVGGGSVGLEAAEYLMMLWRRVAVVEMTDRVSSDMVRPREFLKDLKDGGVEIHTGAKVRCFTADGAVCETKDGLLTLGGFDSIVMAAGSKAYNPLEAALKNRVPELYVIGDAVKARKMENAVLEAAQAAVKI